MVHTCNEQMCTLTLHGYCTACISPLLQPFNEVLAEVVVVVVVVMAIAKESGCSVCMRSTGWLVLIEANSATS